MSDVLKSKPFSFTHGIQNHRKHNRYYASEEHNNSDILHIMINQLNLMKISLALVILKMRKD